MRVVQRWTVFAHRRWNAAPPGQSNKTKCLFALESTGEKRENEKTRDILSRGCFRRLRSAYARIIPSIWTIYRPWFGRDRPGPDKVTPGLRRYRARWGLGVGDATDARRSCQTRAIGHSSPSAKRKEYYRGLCSVHSYNSRGLHWRRAQTLGLVCAPRPVNE